MEPLDNLSFTENSSITSNTIDSMSASTGWMKFMAIAGFAICGIMLIASVYMMTLGAYMAGASVLYVIIALVLFFPNLLLYQYAAKLKSFVNTKSPADLETAFARQKSMYIFLGILLIIYLSILIIALIAAIAMGNSNMMGGF